MEVLKNLVENLLRRLIIENLLKLKFKEMDIRKEMPNVQDIVNYITKDDSKTFANLVKSELSDFDLSKLMGPKPQPKITRPHP